MNAQNYLIVRTYCHRRKADIIYRIIVTLNWSDDWIVKKSIIQWSDDNYGKSKSSTNCNQPQDSTKYKDMIISVSSCLKTDSCNFHQKWNLLAFKLHNLPLTKLMKYFHTYFSDQCLSISPMYAKPCRVVARAYDSACSFIFSNLDFPLSAKTFSRKISGWNKFMIRCILWGKVIHYKVIE